MNATTSAFSRRDFLKTSAAVGGGLLISMYLPELSRATEKFTEAPAAPFAPNAFIRIGTDDLITVIINKSEMGQGHTLRFHARWEELEADWSSSIRVCSSRCCLQPPLFGIQMTGGSTSTASEWERFRRLVRLLEMLVAAAAQNWNVDAQTLKAERVCDSLGERSTCFL
jgi:isoquinoline 1-oxidoreductase beta subunit